MTLTDKGQQVVLTQRVKFHILYQDHFAGIGGKQGLVDHLLHGGVGAPGQELEGGFLWMGSPARKVRPLRDAEPALLDYLAGHYVELKNRHVAKS